MQGDSPEDVYADVEERHEESEACQIMSTGDASLFWADGPWNM